MSDQKELRDGRRLPRPVCRWLVRHGWVRCDGCALIRPRWWADHFWTIPRGGWAGYWDACSDRCENAANDRYRLRPKEKP